MRRACRYALFVLSAALLTFAGAWTETGVETEASQPASSPPGIDSAILKGFQWRSIGPARGGRSIGVSGVKGRLREAYFGAVGGGLWKTVDGG
jgi:hypothetical protein